MLKGRKQRSQKKKIERSFLQDWDFSGGSVVKAPCFQCRGHGFNPRSGN